MHENRVRKIVIVGGGTAGWMAAAPLALNLGRLCDIVLIESPEIGTIGVGEATLPTIRAYNDMLGIDPVDFVKKTQASFKLGIEFKEWGHTGNRFFHGFCDYGPPIEGRSPHLYWMRLAQTFNNMPGIENWAMAAVMARQFKFAEPKPDGTSLERAYSYGYHFDAGLYAAYLRDYATARGAKRVEGTITEVEQHPETGFVLAVKLADGRRIDGDLFIDCSGFRGLLIEGALKAGYDDWSNYLPCNSALAVPCAKAPKLTPYTRSTATSAGWMWRIPLQHRTGNGHVYSSHFMSDAQARQTLLDGLDGRALDEPRQLRFVTGRRRKSWDKNVVAMGLSAGFVEPLESTSIALIEVAIAKLIEFFPDRSFDPALALKFNNHMAKRYESVRDFIILHYKVTRRDDSEFWRYCANMAIPDGLRAQLALFQESGETSITDPDGFQEPSFVAMLMGLGMQPKRYDAAVDKMDIREVHGHFAGLRDMINAAVARMPEQGEFIAKNCPAPPVPGLAV